MTERLDEVLLEVRPKFYKLSWVCRLSPFILFFGVIVAAITVSNLDLFSFVVLMAYILIVLGVLCAISIAYGKTVYKFYKDKITFDKGFLIKRHKSIYYKNIRELSVEEGPIQRIVGLGSILINTAATESHGIYLGDLENIQDIYKKAELLING